MKKLTAIICAAVLSLSTATVAFANPSINEVTIEAQDVKVDAETAAKIPEGMKLVVKEAQPENYNNEAVKEVVTKLNDSKQVITIKEILDILKVDTTKEIKTESGTVIKPEEYEPITKFADIALTDGTEIKYDINGKVESVKATIEIEALKDVKDINNIVLMQMEPEAGNVYFIEIDEKTYDSEKGEITVEFPCLGPFTVMEKMAEEAK